MTALQQKTLCDARSVWENQQDRGQLGHCSAIHSCLCITGLVAQGEPQIPWKIQHNFQLIPTCQSVFVNFPPVAKEKTWSYTKQKLTKPPPNLLNSYFASNLSTKQFCWPVKYRILPPILLANDLSRTPFLWPLKEIPPLDVLGKSWQSWSKNNHLNLIS